MSNKLSEEERVKALMASIELSKTGYAGIDKNGNKVDRREHPEAVPLMRSTPLGIPEPKKVPNDPHL